MCDPTLVLMAGTVIGGAGAYTQGQALKNAGEANARLLDIQANDALERGAAEEASQRRKTSFMIGSQAAKFGASGGEINSGSSLQILADTAEFGELDALRIRSNAEREAFFHRSGAAISRSNAHNAGVTGTLNAAGTLLTGGSQVASKWNVFKADNPSGTFGNFLGFGSPESGSYEGALG